ncbi:MAG: hypothetical protein LKI80_14425 [Sporolactobacillus sp.]|nr:hypothetical protein [Sporolactobacillus sp.]
MILRQTLLKIVPPRAGADHVACYRYRISAARRAGLPGALFGLPAARRSQ